MKSKGKVFVGLSGGVDSSVAAALLKEEGYDVTGVFIKVWQPEFLECTWKKERLDAMRVAAHLDIPFETLDLEKEYKEGVADYMIAEYKVGRTPNPDVMCNKEIKFGAFLKYAKKNGAKFVATGHYARREEFIEPGRKTAKYRLLKGKDVNKDQSYFLWTLTQKQLKHILLPIGDYTKPEIRKMAKKRGLLTAEKKDSQGLCFVGKLNMKDFLAHYLPKKKGVVLDSDGNVVGEHDGAWFLTLGQRHGFTITKKSPSDAPQYIVGKDNENNTVTVSERKDDMYSQMMTEMIVSGANWIAGEPSRFESVDVRIRYRQELHRSYVSPEGKFHRVVFDAPQLAAEGQSAVFYQGDVCMGGAVIE